MWKCGTNNLGKIILDVMKQDQVKKISGTMIVEVTSTTAV